MERAWAEEADLLPRLERGLSPVIEHLLAEHADIVRRLAQLRRCRLELHCSEHEECAEVLMRMRDLEARLQECIDLESAVLFPRALKLEEALYPVRS
jgi:hypothetical protein